MTLHSLNSGDSSDRNRKRLASVSLSPDEKAGSETAASSVRCRHASQGDGRELQLPASAVVLSPKLVLCCNPQRFVGSLVEQQ